jgi:hypothetical protein
MQDLNDYSQKEVMDGLIETIMLDHDVSRALARKLVLNALSKNVVAFEIYNEVAYLLGEKP